MTGSGNPFRESGRVLGTWLMGQILITGITTVLYAVGFYFSRVPLWPLVALLNGLLYLVPRIGGLIGLAIAAACGFFGELDVNHWAILLGTWILVQAIEGFILTPKILGDRLGLSPMLVFLALIAGSFFFGPVGLIAAVPVLAVAGVWWRYFNKRGAAG
jgi:predicted PurR-regulated permease PerM